MSNNLFKSLSGTAVGIALCVSSTAAAASTLPRASISPLVALSAYGTQSSSSAVCAAGSAAVVAAGQAAVVPGTQGCVLPMVDQPVAPIAQDVPPPVYVPPAYVASQGLGFLPLIAGLALVAGLAALLLRDNDDDDGLVVRPVSPD